MFTDSGVGLLTGADYTAANLQCKIYNGCYVAMKQATGVINKNYNSTAANLILADIVSFCWGVNVGSCPTTPVSIKFSNANPFDAMVALTKGLGLYYWGDMWGIGACQINIGTRDSSNYMPTLFEIGTKRGIDRSKQIQKVVILGTDVNGVQIQGSAGSDGGSIKYFTDQKVADVSSLNTLAAFKLLILNNPSTGNPLVVLTDTASLWHPGQYVTVARDDLNLNGTFIIQRITKRIDLTTVEVDIAVNQDDVNLVETDQLNDQPAYTPQPSSIAPTTIILQGLAFLGHLTEGIGAIATDSSPNGNNGSIGGTYYWTPGPTGVKVLSFNGAGYVDIPAAAFPIGGTSAFAVGGWFSPTSEGSDQNYIIYKDGQVRLSQYGTNGQVRFSVHIGGAWIDLISDNNVAPVYGRCFALGVYDGTNMILYCAPQNQSGGLLTYIKPQSGNIDAGTDDVYLGAVHSGGYFSGYMYGVISEQMLWTRSLSSQEAQILYFFPLTEIV